MRRGAVLIGVANAQGLHPLPDAVGAAKRMHLWVQTQGFLKKYVRLITDERSPVTVDRVRKAVTLMHEADPPLDQLLIYFSGHGINKSTEEVWLLSSGFQYASDAVDVAFSARLARHGRIPHVVFISDACRTTPVGTIQQSLTGSEVFPVNGSPIEKAVDLFFACALGEEALEVEVAPQIYSALYTTVLIDLLNGGDPAIVDTAVLEKKEQRLIRPWKLRKHQLRHVAKYLIKHNLHTRYSQTPMARVTSDPEQAFISLLPPAPPPMAAPLGDKRWYGLRLDNLKATGDSMLGEQWRAKIRAPAIAPALSLPDWVDATLDHLLGLGGAPLEPVDREMAKKINTQAEERSKPFVLDSAKNRSGLQVRGEKVQKVLGVRADRLNGDEGQRTFICDLTAPARVLVVFENGSGVLVPLLPQRIAVLTFDNGRWSGLAYETPVADGAEPDSAKKARYLREFVAATAERGVFQVDRETLLALAAATLEASAPDPVLMLHLAYAFDDFGMGDALRQMLAIEDATPFFDVPLLASVGKEEKTGLPTAPPGAPLLARGWPILAANYTNRSALLNAVSTRRRPGRWTHFTDGGVAVLMDEFKGGKNA